MYKVLIDCVIEGQNVVTGQTVDLSTWTPEQINEKIADGTILLIQDELTSSSASQSGEHTHTTDKTDEEVSA